MAGKAKKPIKITETILRDAHQSLIATRMTTEQMVPIIDKMDKVGYHSVECWGGEWSRRPGEKGTVGKYLLLTLTFQPLGSQWSWLPRVLVMSSFSSQVPRRD